MIFEGIRSAAARGVAREPRGDGRERRGPKKHFTFFYANLTFLLLAKA